MSFYRRIIWSDAWVAEVGLYVDDTAQFTVVSPQKVVALSTVQVYYSALTEQEWQKGQWPAPQHEASTERTIGQLVPLAAYHRLGLAPTAGTHHLRRAWLP
uniref:Uncharacterized protein n=1 Tax=Homalodisca liturata TaxID=320908 RepID=A0A1B6K6D6_9HEMI